MCVCERVAQRVAERERHTQRYSDSNEQQPLKGSLGLFTICLSAGVSGLGRKSVACVSLLALGMRDFPVDVNVGRISARLGWIPMQVRLLDGAACDGVV
jgi:hypothetical protein